MARQKTPKAAPAAQTPSTIQIGYPGLDTSGGWVMEEKHQRLRGRQAMRTYEEMAANDATIAAALYSIQGFLRRMKWRVAPAGDSDSAKFEANFVSSCMDDMDQPWSDVISDALSMLPYGFSLHEILYKIRKGPGKNPRFRSKYADGRVGWRKIDLRGQSTIDRWDIADDGEIRGAWQVTDGGDVYLPMSRCVLFRTRSYKNNPEGYSVLRGAYRAWHFKKRLEEVEATGLVRSVVNLPSMQIPARFMSPNASAAERAVRTQFEKIVSLISKDQLTGLVLPAERDEGDKPTGYKFGLIGAAGTQMPVDPVIRRYDSRMLMSLAAEFVLLGTEKTGSFALAAEKSSNFTRSLEWYADVIQDAFNSVVIPRLMEANAVPVELWPKLTHDPIADVDVRDLGLFIAQAAAGGFITPNLETENRLREKTNLPQLTEDQYEDAREAVREMQAPAQPDGADPVSNDGSDTEDPEDT
jgi:hypothetical protein